MIARRGIYEGLCRVGKRDRPIFSDVVQQTIYQFIRSYIYMVSTITEPNPSRKETTSRCLARDQFSFNYYYLSIVFV